MLKVIENFVDESFEQAVLNLLPTEGIKDGTTRGLILRYGSRDVLSDNHTSSEIPELFLKFKGMVLHDDVVLDFDQVSVNVYRPGQHIGWHVDHPDAGPQITIISLCSTETLQLKVTKNITDLVLPRYSLMYMTGDHRFKWQHRLHSKNYRISIVFRKCNH